MGIKSLMLIAASIASVTLCQGCSGVPSMSFTAYNSTPVAVYGHTAQTDTSDDPIRLVSSPTPLRADSSQSFVKRPLNSVLENQKERVTDTWIASEFTPTLSAVREKTPAPIRDDVRQDMLAKWTLSAQSADTGLGLDFELTPRASIYETSTFRSTSAGAEIRIGSNLDLRGQQVHNNGWYLFAGADGEAIVWDVANEGSRFASGGVTLQDKVTVGDMQAGVAFQYAGAQVAVSYIHREFDFNSRELGNQTDKGDFAAISMTWRR